MNAVRKSLSEEVDVRIDEEGILRVHIHEGVEIDLELVKNMLSKYRELGLGPGKEKRLEIMTTDGFASMTKEAREHIAFHGKDYFIAAAVINSSLAIRLLVNFYNSVYRHGVPFKLFASEEKALEWLRKFKKKENY